MVQQKQKIQPKNAQGKEQLLQGILKTHIGSKPAKKVADNSMTASDTGATANEKRQDGEDPQDIFNAADDKVGG